MGSRSYSPLMPQPALTTSPGSSGEAAPVRRHQHRDQVTAGGVPRDGQARGIAAEGCDVPVEPGHRGAHLADQLVHVDGRDEGVVDDRHEDAGGLERARDEAEVLLVERTPVAAVDEDVDRPGTVTLWQEHVERLPGVRAVAKVEPGRKPVPGAGALARDIGRDTRQRSRPSRSCCTPGRAPPGRIRRRPSPPCRLAAFYTGRRGDPEVASAPERRYAISNSPAAPMPPPMHIVTTTRLARRRFPSSSAWPVMRAPLIP